MTKNAVIVAPADKGSLGDEAMIGVVARHLKGLGYAVSLIASDKAANWQKQITAIDTVISDGEFLASKKRCDLFIVIGADVMDGGYGVDPPRHFLHLANKAAEKGAQVSVVGFSFNDHPAHEAVEAFTNLQSDVALNLRDKLSLRRFKKYTGIRRARLVADVALLLVPEETKNNRKYVEWAQSQRTLGRKVIGFNANKHVFKGQTAPKIIAQQLGDILESDKSISIILMPHDYREDSGDYDFMAYIYKVLKPKYDERIMFVQERLSASGIKYITSKVNVIVSGRMHLVIAALSTGTPAAGVVYQAKFEGLYKLFNLRNMTHSPDEILAGGEPLQDIIESLLRREAYLRARISLRKRYVMNLAKKNLPKK